MASPPLISGPQENSHLRNPVSRLPPTTHLGLFALPPGALWSLIWERHACTESSDLGGGPAPSEPCARRGPHRVTPRRSYPAEHGAGLRVQLHGS